MEKKTVSARVSLDGKVALVTGGAMGIGRAVCQALLDKKVKVCMTDFNMQEGARTLRELMLMYGEENIMFAKCDVTSEQEFETAILATKEKFSHFDILVNNAGVGDEAKWERVIDVNLKSMMRGTLLAMKHLVDKDGVKGGTVINTGSILGLKDSAYAPAYCASKHGIVAWSKSWGMSCNVSETNVKVNVICPEAVDTELLSKSAEYSTNEKKVRPVMELVRQNSISPSDASTAYIQMLEDDVTGAVMIVGHGGIRYHEL